MGSVGAALHFIPDQESPDSREVQGTCTGMVDQYRVVSVLGPSASRGTSMTAPIMSTVQVPILSTYATSDELSDPNRFEFLVRLSPPDRFQTRAILELAAYFNWTYVGLVYSDGSYGENGAKTITRIAYDQYGICIGFSEIIYTDATDAEILSIHRSLEKVANLRAVLLFMGGNTLSRWFGLLDTTLFGKYIWIGSDAMGFNTYGAAAEGSIVVHFPDGESQEMVEYVAALHPNNTNNVLLDDFWETTFNCSLNCTSPSCHRCSLSETYDWEFDISNYLIKDAIYAIALGIDNCISQYFPQCCSSNGDILHNFTGRSLLHNIINITFNGTAGLIQFDSVGDAIGHYFFKQYSPRYGNIHIGSWYPNGEGLHMDETAINWTLYRTVEDSDSPGHVPESVCSKECPARHYAIQRELPCCWECLSCRANEIIIFNESACASCPQNYWPDWETATNCEYIKPKHLSYTDSIGIALTSVNFLVISVGILIAFLIIKHRNIKLVRASSRELMAVILIGIFLTFITVFVIVATPSEVSCLVVQFGFNVAVTTVYAPLLVKTIRVYRIFAAGRKGKSASMTSTRVQLLISSILICIQVKEYFKKSDHTQSNMKRNTVC